jgi:pimeloyl-ACP methyl ester carboxylesterase
MLEFFLKKLISLSISLLTVYVPQDKYQKELDALPDIPARVSQMKISDWVFNQVTSAQTGITHYYFECGSQKENAPILLCLHGFNTDGSIFFRLNSLSDKYHIIAYNFPEKSLYYKGNIRDYSDILDDFCNNINKAPIILLGNSIGGGIALNFTANAHHADIKKLVLVSTTVFGATPENQRQIRGMADKLLDYPDYKLYFLLTMGASILEGTDNQKLTEDVPEEGLVIKHVDWYKQILKSFYWYDGKADVPMIHCPVVLIHGKKDKLMNNREAKATQAVFPGAEIHVLENAAHSLVYSHASEVDSIIRKFVFLQ